ncbi:MAG: uracil phosphoribosyltransferase [Haliscomenobacter sp.]|nr:uracil phosphoribosyltransferase [Haliscomenobacter sp.]MBK8653962.1 uracil phosphoribosyltransferase [Haliscomenobacter sp.]MBP9075846.1 uracil phosphoribosyltransferase [Haliscomenobacter sp.]MBP9872487.1 uracil phosphoribosyltransferase [Haliscomenobacter sp.]
MIHNLSRNHHIGNQYLAELRDEKKQQDRLRFRYNLERLGMVLGFELSKSLPYRTIEVETPLGIAACQVPDKPIVLATILRAGLPLHQGLLNVFDQAESAFISAYRKNHKDGSFEIKMEYVSCPSIQGKILILCDPMLATGASIAISTKALLEYGTPSKIHFVTAIASVPGVEHIERVFPEADIWMGALDEELTAKSYIVPGLGDAGDLAFGDKMQE